MRERIVSFGELVCFSGGKVDPRRVANVAKVLASVNRTFSDYEVKK